MALIIILTFIQMLRCNKPQTAEILKQGKYILKLTDIKEVRQLSYEEGQKYYSENGSYPDEEALAQIDSSKKQSRWIFVFNAYTEGSDGRLEDQEYEVKQYTSTSMNIYMKRPSKALQIVGALLDVENLSDIQNQDLDESDLIGQYVEVTAMKSTNQSGKECNIFEGWCYYKPLLEN